MAKRNSLRFNRDSLTRRTPHDKDSFKQVAESYSRTTSRTTRIIAKRKCVSFYWKWELGVFHQDNSLVRRIFSRDSLVKRLREVCPVSSASTDPPQASNWFAWIRAVCQFSMKFVSHISEEFVANFNFWKQEIFRRLIPVGSRHHPKGRKKSTSTALSVRKQAPLLIRKLDFTLRCRWRIQRMLSPGLSQKALIVALMKALIEWALYGGTSIIEVASKRKRHIVMNRKLIIEIMTSNWSFVSRNKQLCSRSQFSCQGLIGTVAWRDGW